MEHKSVTISMPEADYWLLTAKAALDTQTLEEYIRSLLDDEIERILTNEDYSLNESIKLLPSLCDSPIPIDQP